MNSRQAPISSRQDQVFEYVAAVMLQRFFEVVSRCTAVIPLPQRNSDGGHDAGNQQRGADRYRRGHRGSVTAAGRRRRCLPGCGNRQKDAPMCSGQGFHEHAGRVMLGERRCGVTRHVLAQRAVVGGPRRTVIAGRCRRVGDRPGYTRQPGPRESARRRFCAGWLQSVPRSFRRRLQSCRPVTG